MVHALHFLVSPEPLNSMYQAVKHTLAGQSAGLIIPFFDFVQF